MKYQEGFIVAKADLKDRVKKVIADAISSNLALEGRKVEIPSDRDLEVKIKYGSDEGGGSLSVKVSWENAIEESEAEASEDDD